MFRMLGLINQHNRCKLRKGVTYGNIINPHGARHRGSPDKEDAMKQIRTPNYDKKIWTDRTNKTYKTPQKWDVIVNHIMEGIYALNFKITSTDLMLRYQHTS